MSQNVATRTRTVKRGTLQVRSPTFDFADIPRHWHGGRVLPTHMGNGLHLLFPEGERFFIRSVRHFAGQLRDPELLAQVRGFYAQEGHHSGAHERFFRVLEGHGFRVRDFVESYQRIAFGTVEAKMPPKLRLSATVALEHFTAIMAEDTLTARHLDDAPVALAHLFYWHACEEIEHKSVAFDVLQEIDPSYALRMAGLALATVGLASAWFMSTRHLLRQETPSARRAAFSELGMLFGADSVGSRVFARGIRAYLRRDFHPSQVLNDGIARQWLASVGLA